MAKLVLIIDDSQTESHIFKSLLERHGYNVNIAKDGIQGIDAAKELQPDLILMDVVMPTMNGFQATRELSRNELTQHIPIIVCSSKGGEVDRRWALRQGAKEYLVKPVEGSVLLKAIGSNLNGATRHDKPL
ncbi:MAG: two-component system response regulator [Proteobacteria bacterium]|nr:MAG: two-component system response regulator [Pseudomonadota bacterium]